MKTLIMLSSSTLLKTIETFTRETDSFARAWIQKPLAKLTKQVDRSAKTIPSKLSKTEDEIISKHP